MPDACPVSLEPCRRPACLFDGCGYIGKGNWPPPPNPPPAPVPTPGSAAAVDRGCSCPVIDNARGKGAYGGARDENGQLLFWRTTGCPVHPEEGTR